MEKQACNVIPFRRPETTENVPIELALQAAIDGGRMTIKEAAECREAYYNALNTPDDAA